MVMSPVGLRTKNDCASEGQQQFTRQPDKQKHEDNSHKASLGNSTVEKLPVNNKVFLRKPVKVINNSNLINYLF
jgi:hypothetical protein